MKRLDLFVVGLVLTVICGALHSLEVQKSVMPSTLSLMIDVGACTAGKKTYTEYPASGCLRTGSQPIQLTEVITVSGQQYTRNAGCGITTVEFCSSQAVFYPSGAEGALVSETQQCGDTYTVQTGTV
jgi:hypothetical protein